MYWTLKKVLLLILIAPLFATLLSIRADAQWHGSHWYVDPVFSLQPTSPDSSSDQSGYAMDSTTGSNEMSGITSSAASNKNNTPTNALLRVWADDDANVWVNGMKTKPQFLVGWQQGSRIFSLTGLWPDQLVEAVVKVETTDEFDETVQQEKKELVQAGGLYELHFERMVSHAVGEAQSGDESLPPAVEPRGELGPEESSSSRNYTFIQEGDLAARLVYDEKQNLVLSGVQFDGKFLPETMTFRDETKWTEIGLDPAELSPVCELALTLVAMDESEEERTFLDNPYIIQFEFPNPDMRSFALTFTGEIAEGEQKTLTQWISETVASNTQQEPDAKLFLSDKIVSLVVKATLKMGAGKPMPLHENVVIEVLK